MGRLSVTRISRVSYFCYLDKEMMVFLKVYCIDLSKKNALALCATTFGLFDSRILDSWSS
jgi:hypothetical protein